MIGTPFMGLSGAVLLLAVAAGFLVCSIAKKEQGAIKIVGYVIGVSIIAIAGLLIINGLAGQVRMCRMKGCAGPGGMMMKDRIMMKDRGMMKPMMPDVKK
ncbi:MAG: hypothetical protein WC469_04115 [Candidatus Omnitrophota bacterium]